MTKLQRFKGPHFMERDDEAGNWVLHSEAQATIETLTLMHSDLYAAVTAAAADVMSERDHLARYKAAVESAIDEMERSANPRIGQWIRAIIGQEMAK